MSHASLAARYRPQTFAEVTGQTMVKTVLSRAAAQDKVAPAYLFSGTRGVGKTTIARIFAKALNCAHAPGPEPCNTCEQCRRVTQGNHVDVVEIDGASNTGVDDARRLKESIGYAPMEGRYKVFIIDEAHMLSRNAFNALLKTLEEPPPRAIFIMATTEPHKFPPTIVSRCQHFVFQAQPEQELVEHLRRILERENVRYDEPALRLIARRAAGSVRDGMSLLGQTLALGGDDLNEAMTREVLGVAGQEAYERLLHAVRGGDCAAVALLTRELLERGIDIGFFLRELAMLWRNLFLIRQAGAAAAQAIDVPCAELDRLYELAAVLEPGFIHAAWQMVLESQRQVLTSLEPAGALELLLLNLALLPRLVSLEQLSAAGVTAMTGPNGLTGGASPVSPVLPVPPVPPVPPVQPVPPSPPQKPAEGARPEPHPPVRTPDNRATDAGAAPAAPHGTVSPTGLPTGSPTDSLGTGQGTTMSRASQESMVPDDMVPDDRVGPFLADDMPLPAMSDDIPPWDDEPVALPTVGPTAGPAESAAGSGTDVSGSGAASSIASSGAMPAATANAGTLNWDVFLAFCDANKDMCGPLSTVQLRHAHGTFDADGLTIRTMADMQQRQFSTPPYLDALTRLSTAYAGSELSISVLPPDVPIQTENDLKAAMGETPEAQALVATFGAQMLRCYRMPGGRSD